MSGSLAAVPGVISRGSRAHAPPTLRSGLIQITRVRRSGVCAHASPSGAEDEAPDEKTRVKVRAPRM